MSDDNQKYVIFDLDGTLIDSFECVLRCVNRALVGLSYDQICIDYLGKISVDDLFDICKERIGSIDDYWHFKNIFDNIHNDISPNEIKIIPATYKLLKEYVRSGVLPIILTNKKQNIAHRLCSQLLKLNNWVIIGRQTESPLKNDYKNVINRLNEVGVNIKDCIHYYGDSESDKKLSKVLEIPFTKI